MSLTISLAGFSSDVRIDDIPGRAIDVRDLVAFPERPTRRYPEIMTKYEALIHPLAEYFDELSGGAVIPNIRGSAFDTHAHLVGLRLQNAYRISIGQKETVTSQVHDETTGHSFSLYNTGNRTRIIFERNNVVDVQYEKLVP